TWERAEGVGAGGVCLYSLNDVWIKVSTLVDLCRAAWFRGLPLHGLARPCSESSHSNSFLNKVVSNPSSRVTKSTYHDMKCF
ncbi:MAG: hypothetical protein QGI09_06225, partial [Dehalococcoidia bacterium]|nr:hypothetical protein [Dehalococcoidia bacterium]